MKQFIVANAAQAHLMNEYLINEIQNGFWLGESPANHGKVWDDVEVVVTTSTKVGCVDWKSPRLYSFVNEEFFRQHKQEMLECLQKFDPSLKARHLKRELTDLSKIVGGRLTDTTVEPTKANRGNNIHGVLHGEEELVARLPYKSKVREMEVLDDDTVIRRAPVKACIFGPLGL